jgi:hypothetical protein
MALGGAQQTAPPSGEWPTNAAGPSPSSRASSTTQSAYGSSVGAEARRLGEAVPGQLGNEEPVAAHEARRQLDPVGRGAREPVHEHERRPVAADEVAE